MASSSRRGDHHDPEVLKNVRSGSEWPGPTAHSPKTLGTLLHVWCLSFLICVTGDKSHTHLTGLLGRFTVDLKRVSSTWPEKNKRQLLA